MSFRVGRLMGVPVRMKVTWFAAFALLSYLIGRGFVCLAAEGISTLAAIGVGTLIAAALYACLLAHECAHAGVARRHGIKTTDITLSALGGEARLSRDAAGWADELCVAAAGPAVSALLAAGCAVPLLLSENSSLLTMVAFYLAFANGVLAVLNMLPGYPLDGGRAFHALLWRATGDRTRAARIATGAGECIGGLMAAYGAVALVTGDWNGVWFVALGWYIADAAAREWERERVRTMLEHAHAGDVLTAGGRQQTASDAIVDADENAWQVVERMGDLDQDGAVAVAETGHVVGMIEKRELPALLTARLRTSAR